MNDKPEALQEVELGTDAKALLESTKSTVHGVKTDVEDIGETVDYSRMTIEQTAKELKALRKEFELYRFEIRRIIADEIERQVAPLNKQLKYFTEAKSKVIYIKWRYPFAEKIGKALRIVGSFLLFIPIWTIRKIYARLKIINKIIL